MDLKDIGILFQKVFIPVVSVGTAIMVAALNQSVSQVQHNLDARIADTDILIKEEKNKRENINSERDFNFKIYDLVQKSLEDKDERKQEVAREFVIVMVNGVLRDRLLGVLEGAGTATIKKDTAELIRKEKEFNSDEKNIYAIPRVPPSTFNWENWDYDIFWCSASGSGAKTQASLIKNQLENEGAKGRIRVRELPPSINSKRDYNISGYVVKRSGDEVTQAQALIKLSEKILSDKNYNAQFREEFTSQKTKWYISAFICPKS